MRNIPFFKPSIGENEINSVIKVLKSGWLTTGKYAKEFENSFEAYLNNDINCLAVNSATSGLHLVLEAMGVGPGDEVITTTHTFTATAEVIRYLGARPVFVDISEKTYCIDLDKIESYITIKTKCIIPVHFGGLAVEMKKLKIIADKYNLFVLEDAAHSLPSSNNGVHVGNDFSDAAVFSFYANKNITTGEGGMIVTRNSNLAERIKVMRLHGIDRSVFDRFTRRSASWEYDVIAPGYKYNMTDVAASLGIEQLKKVMDLYNKRKNIAEFYNNNLQNLSIKLPPEPENKSDIHSWHLYPICLNEGTIVTRENLIEQLVEKGIGVSVHYKPLHLHTYWKETYNLKSYDFPVSTNLFNNTVSLPIYPDLELSNLQYIVETLKTIIN